LGLAGGPQSGLAGFAAGIPYVGWVAGSLFALFATVTLYAVAQLAFVPFATALLFFVPGLMLSPLLVVIAVGALVLSLGLFNVGKWLSAFSRQLSANLI